MNFGERYGFEPKKAIQINSIDSALRNRLFTRFRYNWLFQFGKYRTDKETSCARYILDKLGYISKDLVADTEYIEEIFLNEKDNYKWYHLYSIVEIFIEFFKKQKGYKRFISDFSKDINQILEEENSGYRFVNDIFVPITDNIEIESIERAIYYMDVPSKHIDKALALYSNKENPDYENSIKESICAVESMCCIICGQDNKGITLGKALNNLEKNGVEIHPALIDAFKKMYGYTSDAGGIRHGSIDFTNAPAEDAKYMLVTCSAFVNYLKEKYIKIGANKQ